MRDFHLPGRSEVYAQNGMVATSHPLAAKVGVQMLEAGGNALDAAMAAALVLTVAEPQMCGLSGDCFALIARPDGSVISMNGSGRAPAGTDAERLRAEFDAIPGTGPHAVTVPTAIDAFCRLNADHGRMSLGDVFAPAVYYVEAGIPVAPRVAFDWARFVPKTETARRYLTRDGTPYATGTLFRSPGAAEVMRRIAVDGRDAFYTGEVAEDMVETLRALGGVHSLDDFAAAEATYTDPIHGIYRGHEVVEHPPNGQGATALMLLNLLQQFDLSGMDPFGAARAHLEVEAAKLAYTARDRIIADPAHVTALSEMLDPDAAARLAARIRPDAVLPPPPPPAGAPHKDTVLVTAVDRDRMAVSLIFSIFDDFGSGLVTDRFGLVLHSRGRGFTLEPGHPNEAGPGKRPLHTILPGLLRSPDGTLMPFGVMGGQYQPMGHARLITNLVDFDLPLQAAIDGPRCFPEIGALAIERGYPEQVRAELAELGHDVTLRPVPLGGAQAIAIRPDGVLVGGSDPRKDGCALGY